MLFGAHPYDTMDQGMQITVAFNHFGAGLVERIPRSENVDMYLPRFFEKNNIYLPAGNVSKFNCFMNPCSVVSCSVTECSGGVRFAESAMEVSML